MAVYRGRSTRTLEDSVSSPRTMCLAAALAYGALCVAYGWLAVLFAWVVWMAHRSASLGQVLSEPGSLGGVLTPTVVYDAVLAVSLFFYVRAGRLLRRATLVLAVLVALWNVTLNVVLITRDRSTEIAPGLFDMFLPYLHVEAVIYSACACLLLLAARTSNYGWSGP
jgi:hypothetical protein